MHVHVKLFASLREQAGWGERRLELPGDTASPSDLWCLLAQELQLAPQCPATIRVAINQHFAAVETPLEEGDEVAFLPPISGG